MKFHLMEINRTMFLCLNKNQKTSWANERLIWLLILPSKIVSRVRVATLSAIKWEPRHFVRIGTSKGH